MKTTASARLSARKNTQAISTIMKVMIRRMAVIMRLIHTFPSTIPPASETPASAPLPELLLNILSSDIVVELSTVALPIYAVIPGLPALAEALSLADIPTNRSIIIITPCIAPQTMKVQLAPCQNPLTRKMIMIFKYVRKAPFLFPPRGK